MFGAVNTGTSGYWWDYGQVKLYQMNNLLAADDSDEASALRLFLGITDMVVGSKVPENSVSTVNRSVVLASTITDSAKASNSIVANVFTQAVNVSGSILMNVTARSIRGHNCIVYNIADDSEGGLVLEDGEVLVGINMPDGEKVRVRSFKTTDGKDAWSQKVHGNKYSFEEMYELNTTADVKELKAIFAAQFAAAAQKNLGS
jgi:hypothetical protein